MREEEVAEALGRWSVSVDFVEKLAGGWNSSTWLIRSTTGTKYVAKLADTHDSDAFVGGLKVAYTAASRGFDSGAPVPAVDGRLAVPVEHGVIALLEYVPGRTPDPESISDMMRVGRALARAHLATREGAQDLGDQYLWPWPWVPYCLQQISMPDEVRQAAQTVWGQITEVVEEHQVRVTVLNGDPNLDGFRLKDDSPRHDGLIDWSASMCGPAVYDIASFAVMHRDTPRALKECVAGYLEVAPHLGDEMNHLEDFVRLRWMANAIYFASRLERNITRRADSSANEKGLEDARQGMIGETLPSIISLRWSEK